VVCIASDETCEVGVALKCDLQGLVGQASA